MEKIFDCHVLENQVLVTHVSKAALDDVSSLFSLLIGMIDLIVVISACHVCMNSVARATQESVSLLGEYLTYFLPYPISCPFPIPLQYVNITQPQLLDVDLVEILYVSIKERKKLDHLRLRNTGNLDHPRTSHH